METDHRKRFICTPIIRKIQSSTAKRAYLWKASTLLAFSLLIYFVTRLILSYKNQSLAISLEISDEVAQFPWVTICSDEPMDPLVVHKIDYFMKEGRIPQIPNISYASRDDYITDIIKSLRMLNKIMGPELLHKLDQKEVKQVLKMVKHFSMAAMLDTDLGTVKKFAVKRDDLILSCSFQGSKDKCNVTEHFKAWLDPLYGLCYTYRGPTPITEPGPRNGLSLILNTRAGKNVFFPTGSSTDPETGSSGVHVTIHEPMTMPVPQAERIDLPPGVSTAIGLDLSKTQRLSRCNNDKQEVDGTRYKMTLAQCQSLCKQEHMIHHCGCHDPYSLYFKNTSHCAALKFAEEVQSTCRFYEDVQTQLCADALQRLGERIVCPSKISETEHFQQALQYENCSCEPPCVDLKYKWQTSFMKWPSDEVMVGYAGIWLPIFFELFRSDDSIKQRMIPENWAYYEHMYFNFSSYNPPKQEQLEALSSLTRANIYFIDTNVVISKELKTYSFIQLLADLCCQAVFWCGLSFFSLLELLETLISKTLKRTIQKPSTLPKRKDDLKKDGSEETMVQGRGPNDLRLL